MLIELRIRDFAVIDDLTLPLGSGLNVLTGETGAGKSIIVDALALLLGERASSEDVRTGASRALVEAVFDISLDPSMAEQLDEMGIESEDGLLILRREVQSEGRNRAWVNGSPATATTVGMLGAALVDLHGQHDHQTLLRRTAQRDILDAFAGAGAVANAVQEAHQAWLEARESLDARRARLGELEAQADFLRFQLEEIQGAKVDPGEEEELDAESRRLSHGQELARELSRVHDALYGGEQAVSDQLAEITRILGRESRLDPGLESLQEMVESALQMVQEAGRRAGTTPRTSSTIPGASNRSRSAGTSSSSSSGSTARNSRTSWRRNGAWPWRSGSSTRRMPTSRRWRVRWRRRRSVSGGRRGNSPASARLPRRNSPAGWSRSCPAWA